MKPPYIVLVCGSRKWTDADPIYMRLSAIKVEAFKRGQRVTLIHGNARGADRLARNLGFGLGFNVEPYPADWSVKPNTPRHRIRRRADGTEYDVAAGRERNEAMLDQGPDLVLAFQVDGSHGTQHTIDEARRRGIPVEVVGA